MATQRGESAPAQKKTHVSASVRLDVATHARVAAAAALEGIDKSTYMARAIKASLKGIVVVNRQAKSGDKADSSCEEGSADAA